jgi:hypothetical protein
MLPAYAANAEVCPDCQGLLEPVGNFKLRFVGIAWFFGRFRMGWRVGIGRGNLPFDVTKSRISRLFCALAKTVEACGRDMLGNRNHRLSALTQVDEVREIAA